MVTSEFTFHGYPSQPDFATLTISMVPYERVAELKSLKLYLIQFRTIHISYEGVLNTIYDDLMKIYGPVKLHIKLETEPRGGIKSILEKGEI
jgi:7-cyano-7-deazaguanine reductase